MGPGGSEMPQHDKRQLMERTMRRAGELQARHERRRRIVRTVPPLVLAVALTAGVTAAVLTATSGRGHELPPVGSGPTTTTAPSRNTTPTSSLPGSTGTTVPVPTGVPGFDPQSFTSVSLTDWWLLGTAPCGSGSCPTIVRTTDGGRSFTKLAFPTGDLSLSNGVEAGLRFADSQHGWAFGSGLAYTSNGGASWTGEQVPGRVIDLEVADGHAFAIVCSSQSSCGNVELLESPVSGGSWSTVALPVQIGAGQAALAVQGQTVVVTAAPPGNKNSPDNLIVSTDGGAHFTVYPSPCNPGLAGKAVVSMTDPTAWWAACPTGMMATAFRSTDSGHTWTAVTSSPPVPQFSNALDFSAVSSMTALAWPGNEGSLELTTDGGLHFGQVLLSANSGLVIWAGFADPSQAYAIVESNATPTPTYELWESSDGGQQWQRVRFSR